MWSAEIPHSWGECLAEPLRTINPSLTDSSLFTGASQVSHSSLRFVRSLITRPQCS